ncbi:Protein of unknown function [Lactobacillus helveticus CIRM-BIA 951]|uniref:Uncharacterized protein n=1 Tax=Lactobacillus helveticus CIRM-BIA 951 TaxID=1226334 RepID=U6F408_LACHE|nr:Protein of unknown function [Lactobacillus helveticus CIRM-BIA 951]
MKRGDVHRLSDE